MNWISRIFSALLLILVITAFRPIGKTIPSVYVSSFENVLGTSFELKVLATSEDKADEAEKLALAEIDRLSSILSSYDTNSEFNQWQKTQGVAVPVSPELFEALSLFDSWRARTHGALDAAAGEVIRVWKNAEVKQQLPDQSSLQQAINNVNQQHWILDATHKTATHLSTVPLVMNSFVKSYIIHKVAEKILAIDGLSGAVVNIGGDMVIAGDRNEMIRVSDPKADAENDHPVSTIQLNDKAIATSGNYRRGFSIGGKWYSHIVDPRTALPVDNIISATVVAPNATDAGALATAFNVLSVKEARELAATINGVEYLIITSQGERIQSEGWSKLEINAPVSKPALNKNSPLQKSWKTDYEVAINLELMRFEGRSRRPFVAIWVEDSQGQTVRTVALWFNKPRWLPDLKEWYHKNNSKYTDGANDIFSISSATRPAGAYTLKWDGKNDKGEYVKQDTYTVYIEVAREHGSYQLIKEEITCKNKPQNYTLPVNQEVNAASIEYRKITSENTRP